MLRALWEHLRVLPAALLHVSKLLGTGVWFLCLFLNWCRAQFLSPVGEWWNAVVLGTVEESIKSFVRESLTKITGAVNSLFAGLVSLFVDKKYAQVRHAQDSSLFLLCDQPKDDLASAGRQAFCPIFDRTDPVTLVLAC